ncbi:MAG: GNAT family N-acetyltransferase [Neomegalonema sp.]|nr:GNAT family N-acetyltransferase [Neomegalonema sp.]
MSHMFPTAGAYRTLWSSEKAVYLSHLRRLSLNDRRQRFHCAMGDDGLARHVDRVFDQNSHVIGWFVDGVLRGACEVALIDMPDGRREAEAAFAVEGNHRGKGVGKELMHRAALFARNHGAQALHICTEMNNKPMLHLAETQGATFTVSFDEVDGVVPAEPRSIYSICLEAAEEEVGLMMWLGMCARSWWRSALFGSPKPANAES